MHINKTRLIIDLGNTLLKVATFEDVELKSLKSFEKGAFDTLAEHLTSLPENIFCIISSVVDYPAELDRLLRTRFKSLFLDPSTPLPIKNIYKTPETLGKDRLAAAVAAWYNYPGKNLLIIDAGTALTMDLVNIRGEFVGGAISPGMEMRFKALHTFTGRLPLVTNKDIGFLTGTTTQDSISSGVINGITCEIDGIIDEYRKVHPGLLVIFGGGDSIFLLKRLKNSIFALSNPVLNGLNIILNYNIENKNIT